MSFSVTRISQSFVAPAAPTPEETLFLSIIDRVAGLRHMVLSLHVFKHGREPAKVIREALAKALVPYYPFAGRFVDDAEHGDVRVACTGEGAWFVEATANCSLEDVRDLDLPLMISKDELLPVPSHEFDPINLPLMIQVTEFTCGGFVVGLISVHTIADGLGTAQFVSAIGDIARGLPKPAVDPVWSREVIPSPPKLAPSAPPLFDSLIELVHTTMDVPESAVNQVKVKYLEHTGQRCSTFDVAIAKLWQSRTRAIGLSHDADVHLGFFANTRHLMQQVLPRGFFGNCFYPVSVTACSGEVAGAELVEVVRMIRDGKARLPAEFERWATGDFKADPYELTFSYNSLFVSDWTRLGFLDVDYGWGKPLHVIPFAYFDFMAVGIIGAPPLPRTGTRIMTQCVGKEQLETFMEEMSSSDGVIN